MGWAPQGLEKGRQTRRRAQIWRPQDSDSQTRRIAGVQHGQQQRASRGGARRSRYVWCAWGLVRDLSAGHVRTLYVRCSVRLPPEALQPASRPRTPWHRHRLRIRLHRRRRPGLLRAWPQQKCHRLYRRPRHRPPRTCPRARCITRQSAGSHQPPRRQDEGGGAPHARA